MTKLQVFLILISAIFISGCANIRYTHAYNTPKGLDFQKKKYLLNDIYTPYPQSTYSDFTQNLKGVGSGQIDLILDARSKGVIVPQDMKFEVEDEHLELLALTKAYDYLIQVSTSPDYETDDMQLVDTNLSSSRARVTIRIYDIYTSQIIYDQMVVAISEKDNNDNSTGGRLSYSAPAIELTKKALSKALSEIKEHKL